MSLDKKTAFVKVEKRNNAIRSEENKRRVVAVKKITASKQSALAFLAKTGVYEENGMLKPVFK